MKYDDPDHDFFVSSFPRNETRKKNDEFLGEKNGNFLLSVLITEILKTINTNKLWQILKRLEF